MYSHPFALILVLPLSLANYTNEFIEAGAMKPYSDDRILNHQLYCYLYNHKLTQVNHLYTRPIGILQVRDSFLADIIVTYNLIKNTQANANYSFPFRF